MIFSSFVENLLGDRIKIRVYRVLARHKEGMTGRGIASLVRTSPFKINQVLRALVSEGIIEAVSMGRANLYRLNQRHVLVQDVVLFLTGYEEAFWSELGKKISDRLRPKPLSVILYGSIARGEEGVKSDIDIHLVYEKRRFPMKGQPEQTPLLEEIGCAYGNPLAITRSTVSEFQRRSRERDPLIRNIIKEGRVLVGMPLMELLSYGRQKD